MRLRPYRAPYPERLKAAWLKFCSLRATQERMVRAILRMREVV